MRYLLEAGIAQEFIGRNAKVVQSVDGARRANGAPVTQPQSLQRLPRNGTPLGRRTASLASVNGPVAEAVSIKTSTSSREWGQPTEDSQASWPANPGHG